ncbi:adenylosuccinate lyase family protein [Halomonas sp. IOP_14]|uniref:lyase family protein n=1 Tax=Halomonas sp. IOP_14 TaxID=2873295 RepID=UPI001E3D1F8E|nr:lyase family protein [Halomonas sp. IOP_14]MCD1585891.1 adenylosuccinate lyase family protein [Halomonas sp. IOP_14]
MACEKLPDSADSLFSRDATWQSWLEVESALAITQAELGMIPQQAADEISRCATLEQLNVEALAADIERTMSPVMSLVRALSERCHGDAGGYVHLGATTQNIILTGKVLQLQRAHHWLKGRLANHLELLATLAEKGADWPCVARTNRRHALPITFGYKVAGWIEELERNLQRLESAEARAFVLTFGGASGAMHSYGDQGQPLAHAMADRLKLGVSQVHSRAAVDGLVEYVGVLALFAAGCERFGQELYTLMANEFDEISEDQDEGVVGSSTMPHKFNPKYAVNLLAQAAELRSLAAPALETALPSHEGDAACNFRLYKLLDKAGALAYQLAVSQQTLLERLVPNPTRMQETLMANAAPLMSEQVMLELAKTVGRQHAHDLVHEAITRSQDTGASFASTLFQNETVRSHYAELPILEAALNPLHYTGQSRQTALKMAASARASAKRLRSAFNEETA